MLRIMGPTHTKAMRNEVYSMERNWVNEHFGYTQYFKLFFLLLPDIKLSKVYDLA